MELCTNKVDSNYNELSKRPPMLLYKDAKRMDALEFKEMSVLAVLRNVGAQPIVFKTLNSVSALLSYNL